MGYAQNPDTTLRPLTYVNNCAVLGKLIPKFVRFFLELPKMDILKFLSRGDQLQLTAGSSQLVGKAVKA
jgi:hypothetical protein